MLYTVSENSNTRVGITSRETPSKLSEAADNTRELMGSQRGRIGFKFKNFWLMCPREIKRLEYTRGIKNQVRMIGKSDNKDYVKVQANRTRA